MALKDFTANHITYPYIPELNQDSEEAEWILPRHPLRLDSSPRGNYSIYFYYYNLETETILPFISTIIV